MKIAAQLIVLGVALAGCQSAPPPPVVTSTPTVTASAAVTPAVTPSATTTPKVYYDASQLPPIQRHARPAAHQAGERSTEPRVSLPPAQDLEQGARPFAGAKIVRQRQIRALSHPDKKIQMYIDDILTFDPQEPELVYSARVNKAVNVLFYTDHNTEALDIVADTLRHKRLLNASGSWLLNVLYNAISKDGEDQFAERRAQDMEAWLARSPRSVAAHYCAGVALIDWAWDARGTGLADQVTEDGWRLFKERLTRARRVLEEGTRMGDPDPYLFARLIITGKGLQLPRSVVRGYLTKAWAIDVNHVWAPDLMYSDYLLPRWGGTAEEHQAFMDELVRKTRGEMGLGVYAVVLSKYAADNSYEMEIHIDWDKVYEGFEDLLKRYPTSQAYLQTYLGLAVERRDHQRAQSIARRILDGEFKVPLREEDRESFRQRLQKLGIHF